MYDKLWLRYEGGYIETIEKIVRRVVLSCRQRSDVLNTAVTELETVFPAEVIIGENAGEEHAPTGEGFSIRNRNGVFTISSQTGGGVLYGVFAFLRLLHIGKINEGFVGLDDSPKISRRMLNHWDNLDGSIERGYAGGSLWKWDRLPKVDRRYIDYARLAASVGINGTVLNNVNADAAFLSHTYLEKTAILADMFRAYNIQVFLSANFAAPVNSGGLPTADPLHNAVRAWWRDKAAEIYALIPDFGGFLVKADSEGQPGPYLYGRTHVDGANMLADFLAPYGGIVIWRAFVYGHGESDRAKKAYADFKPLDGQFRDNAAVQVKNGPIDFQPREPVHPLFGAMEKTGLFLELQITQEYLGQGKHIVFLGPMWKEILNFGIRDPHGEMQASQLSDPVGKVLEEKKLAGIAGVSNTGDNDDWCGSLFHSANLFSFGRLSWDWTLSCTDIAREWAVLTWGRDLSVVDAVVNILTHSWDACVDYMTPLGLHHIMRYENHDGPDPGCEQGERADWKPPYYHCADAKGLGFDRTRKGSNAVDQYARSLADLFDNIETCPEKYLLWFHHVPWDHVLGSRRTLKDELTFRYHRGVESAKQLRTWWKQVEGRVPHDSYQSVLNKLDVQVAEAHEWEAVCVAYFMNFTK
ncbi:MAG: alpha-glucuronidase [Treponema sp.]|jgi:alpha-glucuronidase|nr:alpha-glucuronidase [Treponema sp.]